MEPQKVVAQVSEWIVESQYSTIQFQIRKLFFTVKGSFAEFDGKIVRDDSDIRRSTLDVTVRADSITTGNSRRDAHLRSADFLNTSKYPLLHFESTSVERGRDRDALRVVGSLTIRGERRDVAFDVIEVDHSRSPQGEEVAYYSARAVIDRFDFGLRNLRGLVGRTLKITIYVQAMKKN